MRVHYTGRHTDISDPEKAKAARKFEKVQKVLGAGRDLEAHVILSQEKHHVEAEVTLRALGHTLVVTGENASAFGALTQALDKLEKQAVKNKHKLVDSRRPSRQRDEPNVTVQAAAGADEIAAAEPKKPTKASKAAKAAKGPKIVRGNGQTGKPLTVEEAALLIEEQDRDQLTFTNADGGGLCVLVRRRDGTLELVDTSA
jgi:putative sigma-54 modulation protein